MHEFKHQPIIPFTPNVIRSESDFALETAKPCFRSACLVVSALLNETFIRLHNSASRNVLWHFLQNPDNFQTGLAATPFIASLTLSIHDFQNA